MNCAKSVKMIVILGCIVVNLVGCGMNDTTASSMSTVVSSQDTSSMYGDNVFEKCGINRDGAGEVGKPRYFNGKRHF